MTVSDDTRSELARQLLKDIETTLGPRPTTYRLRDWAIWPHPRDEA